MNPRARAFPFEAMVPNGNAELKPGTFARVTIASTKVDRVLTVPSSSLQYRYGVNRAFVVEGDHVTARELKVGDKIGDRVEVVSGVKAGEAVATGNVETLVDGVKVTVSGSVG